MIDTPTVAAAAALSEKKALALVARLAEADRDPDTIVRGLAPFAGRLAMHREASPAVRAAALKLFKTVFTRLGADAGKLARETRTGEPADSMRVLGVLLKLNQRDSPRAGSALAPPECYAALEWIAAREDWPAAVRRDALKLLRDVPATQKRNALIARLSADPALARAAGAVAEAARARRLPTPAELSAALAGANRTFVSMGKDVTFAAVLDLGSAYFGSHRLVIQGDSEKRTVDGGPRAHVVVGRLVRGRGKNAVHSSVVELRFSERPVAEWRRGKELWTRFWVYVAKEADGYWALAASTRNELDERVARLGVGIARAKRGGDLLCAASQPLRVWSGLDAQGRLVRLLLDGGETGTVSAS